MLSRLKPGLPLFESAMLLVAVVLGWAAFHLYGILNQPREITIPVAVPVPMPMPMPASPPADSSPEPQPNVEEVLKARELTDWKEACVGVADEFEARFREIRDALHAYVADKDRRHIGLYLNQSAALSAWLVKQSDALDRRKAERVAAWLAEPVDGVPPAEASAGLALDRVLPRLAQTFSNYLTAIRISGGQVLTADAVAKRLERADPWERELRQIAVQARAHAAGIQAFLDRPPPPDPVPAAPVVAAAPAVIVPPAPAPVMIPTSVPAAPPERLRTLFYALVLGLILQCVLLIASLYRRFVVVPLHLKLLESGTQGEFQKKLDHFAQLAMSLAHEIRNPLTAINVRLFTMEKSLVAGSEQKKDAGLIRNEVNRLEQIVKDFLRLARPSEPKQTNVSATALLSEVRELLTPQLKPQAIELKLEHAGNPLVQADPVQLKQVLINLVQNAADSIDRKGTITLRAKPAQALVKGVRRDSVVLEIEDTGPGIPPEVQPRLFDPFFSTKENGSGLGLPIAAKIVDQHGGELTFETHNGRGTTFRVLLPLARN